MLLSRMARGGTGAAAAGADGEASPARPWARWAWRAAPHAAAWFPFIYVAVRSVTAGWRPIGDNAAIALRSWDVLTAHAPLVGQATRLGAAVYDPGPLQYWLLTVPVHLDPQRGALWGSALWCMLACSLTIEAARSVAGRAGALLASAMIIGVVAWIPLIAALPSWNPWFGMVFFLAALATAWAALCGYHRWLPVAVICGSVAAQAHLMFTAAAAAVVAAAFAVSLASSVRTKSGYRWAGVSVVTGLACWSAPLVQQFTSHSGNLSALFSKKHGPGTAPEGLHYGLKALAAAAQPPPFWWHPLSALMRLSLIDRRAVGAGLAVLFVQMIVLVGALVWLRCRWLAALAGVSLLVSLAAMITYSDVPVMSVHMAVSPIDNLSYLVTPMIAIGLLAWLTVGSALVVVARKLAGRAGTEGAPAGVTGRLAGWAAGLAALAVAAAALSLSLTVVRHAQPPRDPLVSSLNGVTGKIEQDVPAARQVSLAIVGTDNHFRRRLLFALVYSLRVAGYRPEVVGKWAVQLGPQYQQRARPVPQVTVFHAGQSRLSVYHEDGARLGVRVTLPQARR
jgi:hypothetical protein